LALLLAGCTMPGAPDPTATPAPTSTQVPPTETPLPTPTLAPTATETPLPPTITPTATLVIPATPDMTNVYIYGTGHVGATTFNVTLVSVPPGPPENYMVFVNFVEYECVNLKGQSPWWLYCRGLTPPVGATVQVAVYLRPGTEWNPGSERILLWEGETTIPAFPKE